MNTSKQNMRFFLIDFCCIQELEEGMGCGDFRLIEIFHHIIDTPSLKQSDIFCINNINSKRDTAGFYF